MHGGTPTGWPVVLVGGRDRVGVLARSLSGSVLGRRGRQCARARRRARDGPLPVPHAPGARLLRRTAPARRRADRWTVRRRRWASAGNWRSPALAQLTPAPAQSRSTGSKGATTNTRVNTAAHPRNAALGWRRPWAQYSRTSRTSTMSASFEELAWSLCHRPCRGVKRSVNKLLLALQRGPLPEEHDRERGRAAATPRRRAE